MKIPKEIKYAIKKIEDNGYQAYIVGGCVRDLLLGEDPKDWDVATNAPPQKIAVIFPKNYIDNKFGTVKVITGSKRKELKIIEITTFRTEEKYTDKRHPDKVCWAKSIEEDLSRRDFTINAIAIKLVYSFLASISVPGKKKIKKRANSQEIKKENIEIIDPFGGVKDVKEQTIRAVGDPDKRFQEDALRLMRAIRFAASFNFKIEKKTKIAIKKNAHLLKIISQERIRDELIKIIMSKNPAIGIELLRESGLLKYIIPELLEGYGVGQNKHHIYDVYGHSIKSLEFAAAKGFEFPVRLAVLLHDIGKPQTKNGDGPDSTFYNHEIIGAKMVAKILKRLKFPRKKAEKIVKLVRHHLFYYNVGEVGESSIRRLIRKVGAENVKDLVLVRMADRIGSGCPKALPYKLRHFLYVAEKVAQDPIDVSRLKINGNEIMSILNIKPGVIIGKILNILLAEILDNPAGNNKKNLINRVKNLGSLPVQELEKIFELSKNKTDDIIEKRDEMTKKKYWVM